MSSRAFTFPVKIDWCGGKRVVARVPHKPDIEIATPPEFKGTFSDRWSPEDFLVSAVASCYAVTLVAIAERRELPLRGLTVSAEGTVGRIDRGPFGFQSVRLGVTVTTDAGDEEAMRAAAEDAERGCLVSAACSVPVHLSIAVETATEIAASIAV